MGKIKYDDICPDCKAKSLVKVIIKQGDGVEKIQYTCKSCIFTVMENDENQKIF